MEGGCQRGSLTARGQVSTSEVGDHAAAGQLGQQAGVVQLKGIGRAAIVSRRCVLHGLAVAADGADLRGRDVSRSSRASTALAWSREKSASARASSAKSMRSAWQRRHKRSRSCGGIGSPWVARSRGGASEVMSTRAASMPSRLVPDISR